MISKIDKKVLVILIVVLALILLSGIAVYKYLSESAVKVQNSVGGVNTDVQAEIGGTSGQGNDDGFSICLDKCGDNVCQNSAICSDQNKMNCVCPETPQECPQDCK